MRKIHSFYLIIPLVFLMMLPIFLPPNNTFREEELIIKPSETVSHTNVLWLDNPTFEDPIEPTWYPSFQGDVSDVVISTSLNQGDITIIGESRNKQVLLNTATQSNWMAFNKSDLEIVPQRASVPYYGVDDDGAWCSHWWDEGETGGQPKNTPRMHWRTNVSMPVDMSDYIITSLSFSSIINASVDPDIDTPNDVLAKPGTSINQFETYDYAQFYVEVTTLNIDELNTYRIAFNQTRLLGNENLLLYDIEGNIGAFDEQAIIDAVNNVLAADPGHNNFTIVIGIYMYCEDNNSGTDRDHWDDMRFKFLNLTFSYEKKIDQFTSGSWAQDLDEISGSNVQITDANLNFKYKIDRNWTESSQNSHIRIYINERKFDQTISLIDYIYSSSFQDARSGGYDIKEILLPYENFTFSIQVYLAEDFELDNNITISITDIYLYVSYTETFSDPISENWLFVGLFIIAVMGATVLAAYLIAYQMYLKYPIPVRKVRKYRKTLSSDKTPGVGIVSQKRSFNKDYQTELKKTDKFLKGSQTKEPVIKDKLLGKKEGELPK
jgi:hypothetical protein